MVLVYHNISGMMQEEGPTEEEAAALLTLEQRARETAVQENSYWHDMVLTCYKSRLYKGVRCRSPALAARAPRAPAPGSASMHAAKAPQGLWGRLQVLRMLGLGRVQPQPYSVGWTTLRSSFTECSSLARDLNITL